MDSQKSDEYKLMDSQKKTDAHEMTAAQKKTDGYELMNSHKTREYEVTGCTEEEN